MGELVALMTTSLDGFYTGPNEGPSRGLGEGGERLHYRVFGKRLFDDGVKQQVTAASIEDVDIDVVLVLDTSRTSAGRVGDVPRLDAALDAALLLTALDGHGLPHFTLQVEPPGAYLASKS